MPVQNTNFPLARGLPPVDPMAEYDAMIRAQQERMARPQAPMYSPEEQDARQTGNERDYALGLLGALSGGKTAGDVGGLVLKNAIAARQPKVSERGSADQITGKFTYNPDYLTEKQEAELTRLQTGKAEAARKIQEDERRSEDRRQASADRRAALGAAGAGRAAAQDARNWTVEDRMLDDFNKETKTHQMVLGSFQNLQSIAQKTDAPSDIAFIYSYMKMLDPGSVVREGEFATAQNAAGIPERIRNAYNGAMQGTRLNPQQRAEMLGTAGRLAQQAETGMRQIGQQYVEKGTRRQLNPENIVTDPRWRKPAAAPPPPPKREGGATGSWGDDAAGELSPQEAAEMAALKQKLGR
jgi:hypothetical protein